MIAKQEDFLKKFVLALRRALELEGVESIKMTTVTDLGEKNYLVTYYFLSEPTEEDQEALSLIETELFADIWGWVGTIQEKRRVVDQIPNFVNSKEICVKS